MKLTLDNEVAILLQYLKLMPATISAQFLPILKKLSEDPRLNQLSREKIVVLIAMNMDGKLFEPTRNNYLVDLFFRFLEFN